MPTYVYACRNCDHKLEIVQKMSDAALTDCPECEGSLRRVLFPPAVVYKGSGFYTTDYKNGGRKADTPPAVAASSGDSKSEATTSTSGESTTPAKAETAAA